MKKIIILPIIVIIFLLIVIINILLPTKVAVLGYHDFTKETSQNELIMNINKFERQMKYLQKHHYHSLTLKEMECFMKKECKIPKKSVLITFDDGYMSNYTLAFPILKKYNLNAVVFYMGINYDKNNNYMNQKTLEKTKEEYPNIEIASHSFDLHHESDIESCYTELDKDIKRQQTIVNSKYYAYPYGSYNEKMIKALKDNNYEMAFTFGPGKEHRKASIKDDIYKVPRLNMGNSIPMWKYILRLILPI